MKVLITGAAGFIGSAVALRLLERGDEVIGVDNLNDYYDVKLKAARLERLEVFDNYHDEYADIEDASIINDIFVQYKPERVINLAAQVGVRYSLENPQAYINTNIIGFLNILEVCRNNEVEHLVYASSSSVYGANTNTPYSVDDNVDHPISIYATSKKTNELMAHTYSHLYQLPTTGLRFFTVYGPWGRPDMSYSIFAKNILAGKSIDVFDYGRHLRDFTYIDDIVEGVVRVLDKIPTPTLEAAPYSLYNIGNNKSVELITFIRTLEKLLEKRATMHLMSKQPGDVDETYADITSLVEEIGYEPKTTIEDGLAKFVDWYKEYYNITKE